MRIAKGGRRQIGGGLTITRRTFLGAAAAGPILGATDGLGFAADVDPGADIDAGAALDFILSPDERSVIVRRVRPANDKAGDAPAKDPLKGPHKDWTLEAAAFGPNAWFDLDPLEFATRGASKKGGTTTYRRRLAVREVSWGNHGLDTKTPLYLIFDFQRVADGTWDIGLITNVWPSNSANAAFHTEDKNRQPLHMFIKESVNDKDKRLKETLSAKRINPTLDSMFDGQLSVVDTDMMVALDRDIAWHLEPIKDGERSISAFGGTIKAPVKQDTGKSGSSLSIGWEQMEQGQPSPNRRLAARCRARWTGFSIAANGKAPGVEILPAADQAPTATADGDLYVGQLDPRSKAVVNGGRDSSSVVAMFSTAEALVNCRGSAQSIPKSRFKTVAPKRFGPPQLCTGLALDDVTITRIRVATAWRDVAVADAAGKRETISKNAGPATLDGADAPGALTSRGQVGTIIGCLKVKPLPVDTAAATDSPNPQETPQQKSQRQAQQRFDAASAAAIGDRSGMAGRSFYLLADRPAKAGRPDCDLLREMYADVALQGLDAALPGTRDSAMLVQGSHFRFVYSCGQALPGLVISRTPWGSPDGYLWLGDIERLTENRAEPLEICRLNLGGTVLYARRDQDLVDLRFHFSDFTLVFEALNSELGKPPLQLTLQAASTDVRQTLARLDLTEAWYVDGAENFGSANETHKSDGRPMLAVEFAPQHVMEEAFFRQEPAPLPDTEWPKTEDKLQAFLDKLQRETDVTKRANMRKSVGEAKEKLEQSNPVDPDKPFFALRQMMQAATGLPDDQREYFGPFEMSADAIRVARKWQLERSEKVSVKIVDDMLQAAGGINPPGQAPWSLEALLKAETDAENTYPLYKLWRDAFRVFVIENGLANLDPSRAEFVNPIVPPRDPTLVSDAGTIKDVKAAFIQQISGNEPFKQLAMARLSGRSLLSFKVNFEPAPGDSYEVNQLPAFATDNADAPGPGAQRFGAIPFHFDALTDWSRFEPNVPLRAQKLYKPLPSGALPPVAGRVASVDDHAILEQQGFVPGVKTSVQHLAKVFESLNQKLDHFETRIELPARLMLSTAQNAVWQAPRKVSRTVSKSDAPFETAPVATNRGSDDASAFGSYEQLWTARLLAQDAEPGVRAVWSPDLRAEAIGYIQPGGAGVPRIAGPPPRGPWAPWVLRREQVDGVRYDPALVKKAMAPAGGDQATTANAAPLDDTQDVCPTNQVTTVRNRTPNMFERICEIFRLRTYYNDQADLYAFRSSLDAYDRHELVLLTSAYGLPVTGRRQQTGSKDTDSGGLVERSGQFEPGEAFHLTDADRDYAFYRPKPLDVFELSLSALGGVLDHDTNFLPPAPAMNFEGRSMFDGLSIERWQHKIVLGRDVIATVVYSGYLFPLGHKASLVKITERIFVQMEPGKTGDDALGVKAILRQRMFVRVSSPTKKFPAVGQPNKGRQWCSDEVTMLTRQTPDIVDPNFELTGPSKGATSPSGRIFLDNQPGLAFWPQTAPTPQARVPFEFLLDGRRTRMPLIFVDRIAAKNQPALQALLQHYNGLAKEAGRVALLAGQTMRFAESVKDGDTSFATERLVLSVEGRSNSDDTWEGANDVTRNTGVLEGADQPPFYPVMASARIHIGQAETLSGGSIGAVDVRFDGNYVSRGFPTNRPPKQSDPKDDTQDLTASENASEAFLYVDMGTPPVLSMGPNGNQSGGVGRPDMNIVGLSRSKGILGAQPKQAIYQSGPAKPLATYAATRNLLSVASHFSMPPPPTPATPDDGPKQIDPKVEEKNSTVFESFFSADAKLLGVISFQTLMKLMKLVGGVDAIPALQEAVEYGSQALQGLEQGAADAMEFLRHEVLSPLLQLVRSARKEWSSLDNNQLGIQGQVIGAFSKVLNFKETPLRKLYPEIDNGLNNLEAALVAAIGETDLLVLTGRLGAVYEAGRAFMRELARLAANPLDRIEAAARMQFEDAADRVAKLVSEYEGTAQTVIAEAKDLLRKNLVDLQARFVAYLVRALPFDEIETLRRTDAGDLTTIDKTIVTLQTVQVDLSPVVQRLKDGDIDPKAALYEALGLFFSRAEAAADKAQSDLAPSLVSDPVINQVLRSLIAIYRVRLGRAETEVRKWVDTDDEPNPAPPAEWAQWIARCRTLRRVVDSLQRLQKADNPKEIFAIVVQLGRDFLGVNLPGLADQLRDTLSALTAQLAQQIVTRLATLATNVIPAPPDIRPALSEFVVSACIAKTPVPASKGGKSAADDVERNVPSGHFLKGFAGSAANTHDFDKVDGDLDTALKTLEKITNVPQAETDKLRAAIGGVKSALPLYRELFCTTATIVGRAQQAQQKLTQLLAKLAPAGNPPVVDSNAVVETLIELRELAQDIEQGTREARSLLVQIGDTLAKHLDVIASMAAAGALAAAFKNELKDFRDQLDQWDSTAASGARTTLDAMLRLSGLLATSASTPGTGILASGAKAVRDLIPSALDPERENLAQALDQLSAETAAKAAEIAGLTIAAPSGSGLGALLKAEFIKNGAGTSVSILDGLRGKEPVRFDTIEGDLSKVSSKYEALVGRAQNLPEALALSALDGPVKELLSDLSKAYGTVSDLRDQVFKATADYPVALSAVHKAFLVEPLGPPCNPLTVQCDRLAEEIAAVKDLLSNQTPVSTNRTKLQAFAGSISGNKSAVAQIVQNIEGIWDDIARGDLAALVDIAALRDQVEQLISQLMPVKRTLRYALGFDFDGDKIGQLSGGVFVPRTPSSFQLDMLATIDLLNAKADMHAAGHIGPFDVKLIGEIFDAVTLIFDGVDFEFKLGGSPRFDVLYRDFQIGPQLEFVRQLQSYFTPASDGSGFFIEPMRGRPGIVAGYGINLGTIQLGGISFSNLLLNAAAELPFDGQAAIFRFALGRTLAPFLISVPPYGGGGFVAIYADAKGFRGFEASFEFGGVADFSTGPLVARGRLTAGFYIRSMKLLVDGNERTVTDIYGTFFAGGEASIWIFSFYASLYVRLGMKQDGTMEGIATFTFSFSMGLADFDFQVTVHHSRGAFGGSGGGSGGSQRALLDVDSSIMTASTRKGGKAVSARQASANVEAATSPLSMETADAFLGYFDLGLLDTGVAQ